MAHSSKKRQKFYIALGIGFGLVLAVGVAFVHVPQTIALPPIVDGVPIPFSSINTTSTLVGSITTLGRRTGSDFDIRVIAFNEESEEIETLRGENDSDHIDFVLTPDSTSVPDGTALGFALVGHAYGYLYTGTENPSASTLAERWPGTFFSTYRDISISQWESENAPLVMRTMDQANLQRNARYIIVSNGPTTFRVRGFQSPLNNERLPLDANNDGRVSMSDNTVVVNDLNARGARRVSTTMTAPPYLDVNNDLRLAPSDSLTLLSWLQANEYCGNNHVGGEEQCDDGNETNGDGCSEICQRESSPLHKASMPQDVNNDDVVNRADFNACVADMNARGARQVTSGMTAPPYTDVTGNWYVSAGDCNSISNWLNNNPWCGNSIVSAGEECDDGNTVNNDLCTNDCKVNAPF